MLRRPLIALSSLLTLVPAADALAAARPHAHRARTATHTTRRAAVPAPSGTLVIRGGGYGHGIGMSQYGALGYAEHGASYQEILAHYYAGTALGTVDPNAAVRVLLKTGSAAFSGVSRVGGTRLNPSLTYSVEAFADGTLGLVGPNGKPVGPHWQAPLGVGNTGGTVSVAGLGLYRGGLEFRPDGSGGVQTVDVLGLDDYVRGVVASESPSSWPGAALEAQAVAARTYALTTSVSGNGYSLYPDTRSQMYGGVGAETAATDAAVAATRGQVVTYGGHPVVTYFFSSSGGYTASIQDVWTGSAPEPWLRAVPDPYDNAGGNPYHSWTFTYSLKAAAAKLGSLLKGTLVGIRIVRHGDSPRVLTAQVVGTKGTTTVSGATLQQVFGLQTTLVTFTTITAQTASHHSRTGGAAAVHDVWLPNRIVGQALAAVLPAARLAAHPTVHALKGTVTPAERGDRVAVEELSGHRWHRVATVHVGRGSTVSSRVSTTGTYRFRWRTVSGPAVRVS